MNTPKTSPSISRRNFLKISALTTAGALAGLPHVYASTPEADLVLINGKVITMDSGNAVFEAVAVRNGKILDTGATAKIDQYIGGGTRIIDLKGRTVTPGLIDSHAHLPPFGLRETRWVKLQGMGTKDEIFEAIAKRARVIPKGSFINAWGIEDNSLSFMDRTDLDNVTSEHPVLAIHTTGQWGFANSYALKLAGIDQNTPNPPGSRVQKGLDGKPTGLLIHYPALYLVRKHMPAISLQEARQCISHAAELYAREGVTTIHDNFFMISEVGSTQFINAYIDLLKTEELATRVKIWPYIPNLMEAKQVMTDLFSGKSLGNDSHVFELYRLRKDAPRLFSELWGGLKIAVDGSGRTSLWHSGGMLPLHSTEDLQSMVDLFHRADQQVSVHAVGDRAVDLILDAFEAAQKAYPRKDARHRIEHAILPQTRTLKKIQQLGVVISTHPQFIYFWGDKWKMKNAGEAIPLQSYLTAGIPVAMGADPPAFPLYQPQFALWQAVRRTTRAGISLDSAESITIKDALRLQTIGGAYAGFQERTIGSLEKGKCADMVVWDKDFYRIPTDEIKDVKALMTFVAGRLVFAREKLQN